MKTESILTTFEDWTLRLVPATQKPSRMLLMLHGWTGDENSMWPFAVDLPEHYWLVAPRAPFNAVDSGYSWRAPGPRGFPSIDLMRQGATMLKDFIERWGIANAVDTSHIDAIGFSQGGAMCVTLALFYPHLFRRIGVLAGFVPYGSETFIPDRPLDGKQIFWAHGVYDKMVTIDFARESMRLLEGCGATINYCEAEVGHRVSSDCVRALRAYLTA